MHRSPLKTMSQVSPFEHCMESFVQYLCGFLGHKPMLCFPMDGSLKSCCGLNCAFS